MSVSGISGSTPIYQPPAQDTSFRTAFQQLTSAIGSGDLQAAQSAYASLSNLQQGTGQSGSQGPMAQFLSSIGNDLNSGSITSAQSNLATFQKAHGGGHHHGAQGADQAQSGAGSTGATGATGATGPSGTNLVDMTA